MTDDGEVTAHRSGACSDEDRALLDKRRASPYFAVFSRFPSRALWDQEFQDFRVVHRILPDEDEGWIAAADRLGRVLLYVLDDSLFDKALRASGGKLLVQLSYLLESRDLALLLLTTGHGDQDPEQRVFAYAFAPVWTFGVSDVPRQGDLLQSLYRHLQSTVPGKTVVVCSLDAAPAEPLPRLQDVTAPQPPQDGFYRGPIPTHATPTFLAQAWSILTAPAYVPFQVTSCQSNQFYGHDEILRAYCGEGGTPVAGRIQHGWTPGVGVNLDDLTQEGHTSFVWAQRSRTRLELMGFTNVAAIGAPYLYLPPVADAGPADPQGLLAVPHHSIRLHRIDPSAWSRYIKDLRAFAARQGYSRITACLHILDYQLPADSGQPEGFVREQFHAAGIRTVTCGFIGDPNFLRRCRALIRAHAAVTSNRIGTAVLYALHERRPTWIAGDPMATIPPDQYENLTGDPVWIAQKYPGIWAGGLSGVEEARSELGTECKRSPDEIRRLLFGWLYGTTPTTVSA